MAVPPSNIPWGLHPLQPWIKTELENRSKEINMNIPTKGGLYSGPKTAWTRFFSNGKTPKKDSSGKVVGYTDNDGFMMFGVNGFDDSYGFNLSKRSVMGLNCYGTKMSIPANTVESYPHRPPPAVESIDVSLFGGQNASFSGLCRKARVNWKCYSLDQLEFLTPYFLTPKVTAVVEWGWNNYNEVSLINLSDTGEVRNALFDGKGIMKRIQDSNGNYDAMLGFIFDYGFSMNPQGGYDCFTEFVNANWLLEGQEYKNTTKRATKKDKDGKTVDAGEVKNFVQFVEDDLGNLVLKSNEKSTESSIDDPIKTGRFKLKGRTFTTDPKGTTNDQSHGASVKGSWIRMDLVQDILNQYFSIIFKDIEGNEVGNGLTFDISDTIICGHPAIKSVSEDVLIPNAFAPRFTTAAFSGGHDEASKSLVGVGEYLKTFRDSGVVSAITNKKLSTGYDDLRSIINPSGNSFPMITDISTRENNAKAGMWGYLKDIFVSVKMVQDAMSQNDTALRLTQHICDRINASMCGIVQLKVLPSQLGSQLTIIDTNYNPVSTPPSVSSLLRFTPGSVNSAYMTNVALTVKLSQEMANQMVAQSSAGKSSGDEQSVGVQDASRFVGCDRLYEQGSPAKNVIVETDDKKDTSGAPPADPRDFSDKKFMWYQDGSEKGKKYILVDPDPSFMTGIVTVDPSKTAIYINSPIMPGTKFEMETLGIGGFTFLGQFTLDHVPKNYAYTNCVWQIADIKQSVSNGVWKTHITADCRPLSFVTK